MGKLRKAERKQAKLRIGLSAPSGAGKTYSALLLAEGMTKDWSKIALIDTENGSGELYSDLGEYNVLPLEAPYTPERYIEAIIECEQAGMEVIIIDSISHEWEGNGGCLEINDKLAQAKFKGNTWAAWSQTTPRHQAFLEKITTSSCHIITTVRNKIETIQEGGKVKKVGTKEISREGYEYELTINFNIDRDGHLATASKDRTKLFIDRDPFIITPAIGEEIIEWNKSGKKMPTKEDQQEMLFTDFYEKMQKCKNMDCLKNLFLEIHKNKNSISAEHLKTLSSLKDDMKKSLEEKAKKTEEKEEVK